MGTDKINSELAGEIRCGWYHPTVPRRLFKSRFYERFNCPPLEYGERTFREHLRLPARWPAAVSHKLGNPA